MPEHARTFTVDVEPDDLFDYLTDVRHLPEYFPPVLDAQLDGADEVSVEAEVDGRVHRGQGWLHVDGLERRAEWGQRDGPYRGWLQIDPADQGGSIVTVHIHQEHQDEVDAEVDLDEAVENIQRLTEAGAA